MDWYVWAAIGAGVYLMLLGWGYLGLVVRLRRLETALGDHPDNIAQTRTALKTISELESSIAAQQIRTSPRPPLASTKRTN